jgi:23S rRNA (adenine2503-C2)-methyltransferase
MQSLPINSKIQIAGFSKEKLKDIAVSLGQPTYKGDQLYNWINARRVLEFSKMSNLSKTFIDKLEAGYSVQDITLSKRLKSQNSNCEKYLFELSDGNLIETVWMGFEKRNTLCVSTQAGCAFGCKFCATATLGLKRHLTNSEIMQQLFYVVGVLEKPVSNIVFMGMGEPLHNYDNVVLAIRQMNDMSGMALSRRRMTVSTVGLVPEIIRLAEEDVPCKLAVSLNAVFDSKRSELMPINRKYNLDSLFRACKTYTEITSQRVTFEYVLMEGENDKSLDLRELKARLSRLPSKLNLIHYNQTDRGFTRGTDILFKKFFDKMENAPFPVTLRQSMGTDIAAACGQLLAAEESGAC